MSDFCKHRCYIICFGFLEFGAVNQFYALPIIENPTF